MVTEYRTNGKRDVYLLDSGEYASFSEGDDEPCREIVLVTTYGDEDDD